MSDFIIYLISVGAVIYFFIRTHRKELNEKEESFKKLLDDVCKAHGKQLYEGQAREEALKKHIEVLEKALRENNGRELKIALSERVKDLLGAITTSDAQDEFDQSLDPDPDALLVMTEEQRDAYYEIKTHRRQVAHEKNLTDQPVVPN